jgi:L-ascorbate oxidase
MLAALTGGIAAGTSPAPGEPLREPPVFASSNGEISVLMVAAAQSVDFPGGVTTTAWPYEVCYRPAGPAPDVCPAGAGQHPLGGVRLQLEPGDTLRIRLVNKLPPALDAKHAAENPELANNPTNLHTHGLIVEPHRAEGPGDTYGDYVFVVVRNPDNAAAPVSAAHAGMAHVHPDMDFVDRAVEYKIDISPNHPSGLYWFHPHIHGVSLNQVSAGMAGIITIGSPTNLCRDDGCKRAVQSGDVRHLVLKDEQVEADGTLLTQEDPGFCDPQPAPGDSPRHGACPGIAPDHTGGSWFHTLNGQVYPRIDVGPLGNVWRLVNASGSRSYALSLTDDATGAALPLQLLAIDGVSVDATQTTAPALLEKALGAKARAERCPGGVGTVGPGEGICTSHLRMMPSSRVEVRVIGSSGRATAQSATLRTDDYFTGGDDWPAIELAQVKLAGRDARAVASVAVGGQAAAALSASGSLQSATELQVPGLAKPVSLARARDLLGAAARLPAIQTALQQAQSFAIDPALKLGLRADRACRPLAPGHRRKILFGNPTPGVDGFGLGYVEVDAFGHDIEATRQPIAVFDPSQTTVCIPLGANGNSVAEIWELVNLTAEDHNFHIHQTRFNVLSGGTIPGTDIPTRLDDMAVLHDNLPLPRAADTTGCDGSVEATQAGACNPDKAVVRIPFREVGDFVFHCHILEHEDGGMMARIRVVGQMPL